MYKQNWEYRGRLKSHSIHLLHFNESTGDLYISLNGSVIVREVFLGLDQPERVFNFFVDDELCEVSLQRKAEHFFYKFKHYPFSTSKTGQARKLKERFKQWGGVTAVLAVLLFIGLPLSYMAYLHSDHTKIYDLSKSFLSTTATVTDIKAYQATWVEHEDGSYLLSGNVRYKFKVNDHWYWGAMYVPPENDARYYAPSGFPILINSEFEVNYHGTRPEHNRLRLMHPSQLQMERYAYQAFNSCRKNRSQTDSIPPSADMYCECQTGYLYANFGLEGLSLLNGQTATEKQNRYYNETNYTVFASKYRRLLGEIDSLCLSKSRLGEIGLP